VKIAETLPSDRRWRLVAWVGLVVVSAMCLSRLSGFGLADPDEGRYAEIPREMIKLGDWINPHLAYVDYFEKPPLLYWLVALSFRVFGASEWAARLVPAGAGILGVVLTHALGLRLFGRRAAVLAAAILITSPLYFALSQVLVTDMLLTACMTATLLALHQVHAGTHKRPWSVAAAVCAALGVLAKGPVALLIPGLTVLAFQLFRRDGTSVRALVTPWPIVTFVAVATPWFVAVSLAHPDFPYFYLVHENIGRLWSSEAGHPEPLAYYVPVLLGGFFPWTILVALLAGTKRSRAAARALASDGGLLLVLWSAIVVVAFTAVRAKLSPYVLPAFPAFALLLGGWLDRLLDDPVLPSLVSRFAGCVCIVGAVMVVARIVLAVAPAWSDALLHLNSGSPQAFVSAGTILALAMLATGLPSVQQRRVERSGSLAAVLLVAAGAACGQVAAVGARGVLETSRNVALAIEAIRAPGDTVIAYRQIMQGLFFYTGDRVIQVDGAGVYGELQFGAASAPDAADYFWIGRRRLREQWQSGHRVFIVVENEREDELTRFLDPPAHVLVRDDHRAVLVNFPPVASAAADRRHARTGPVS